MLGIASINLKGFLGTSPEEVGRVITRVKSSLASKSRIRDVIDYHKKSIIHILYHCRDISSDSLGIGDKILGGDQLLVILCGFGTKSLEFGISFLSMTISGAASYAYSGSLLLTPLCCDDIHDVTPRVSALAGCETTRDEFMNFLSASLTKRITEQVKNQLP
ncbi:hypothetical protein Tco_0700898 [Tanacetum coccineum]